MVKICVLFGSFNPLTNAHITALRSAVEAIGADKGLFVATNGQYLKRKTVKINDPFYLSEDERKAIIEKVCESESKLEFWGFGSSIRTPRSMRFRGLIKYTRSLNPVMVRNTLETFVSLSLNDTGSTYMHSFVKTPYSLNFETPLLSFLHLMRSVPPRFVTASMQAKTFPLLSLMR